MTAIKHLNIEVTRRCNQRCFYCFNESGPHQSDATLTPGSWRRILRVLQSHGLQSVHITGGEPFIWSGTVPLLRSAQEDGLSTSILSNGYRIPELLQDHPDIFRRLTVAQVSLDSLDATVNNSRRGTPHAHRWSLAAIEALRAAGITVEVSCVVDDSNASALHAIVDFCSRLQCKLLARPMLKCGRAAEQCATGASAASMAIADISRRHPAVTVLDRFAYLPDDTGGQAHLYGKYTADPQGLLRHSACVAGVAINDLRAVA